MERVRFVTTSDQDDQNTHWNPPPATDFGDAIRAGRAFAARFVRHLNRNACGDEPGDNILGAIAGEIDYRDRSPDSGYWIGFFSYLEHLLVERTDPTKLNEDLERQAEIDREFQEPAAVQANA